MVGASLAKSAALSYSSVATGTSRHSACGQGGGGPHTCERCPAALLKQRALVRYSTACYSLGVATGTVANLPVVRAEAAPVPAIRRPRPLPLAAIGILASPHGPMARGDALCAAKIGASTRFSDADRDRSQAQKVE